MLQVRTSDGELFVAMSAYEIVDQMRKTLWDPRPSTVEQYIEGAADRVEQMTGKRPRQDPEAFLDDLRELGLIECHGVESDSGKPGAN